MEKTIIYLIRHSEQLKIDGIKNIEEADQINNEKIILSINGEIKAKELSDMDELKNLDIIWSSNYVRAIATAKYIAYKNNLSINIDSKLNERKLGDLEELKKIGEGKKFSYTEEQLLDENLKNVEGESRAEVNQRMLSVLNDILDHNKGKRIAIISHGAAIKFLLMNWCKLDNKCNLVYKNKTNIDLKYPSAIKLEFNDKQLENLSIIK